MGQSANSGRQAKLDEQKERAAGRNARTGQSAPGREEIRDAVVPADMKGKTGGAYGEEGMANRKGGVGTQGGGGGGGEPPPPKDNHLTTGRSTRPAKKHGPV